MVHPEEQDREGKKADYLFDLFFFGICGETVPQIHAQVMLTRVYIAKGPPRTRAHTDKKKNKQTRVPALARGYRIEGSGPMPRALGFGRRD